jgi:hypothetical protein
MISIIITNIIDELQFSILRYSSYDTHPKHKIYDRSLIARNIYCLPIICEFERFESVEHQFYELVWQFWRNEHLIHHLSELLYLNE